MYSTLQKGCQCYCEYLRSKIVFLTKKVILNEIISFKKNSNKKSFIFKQLVEATRATLTEVDVQDFLSILLLVCLFPTQLLPC